MTNDEFRMTKGSGFGAQECFGDLGGGLGAHVEDLGVFGQGGTSLLKEAADGAGIAGGDAEIGAAGDGLEAWIAMRGHFAEVGDCLKAGSGFAELAENFVFHARGYNLGIGATAIENGRGR
jgi:hypothetical protein